MTDLDPSRRNLIAGLAAAGVAAPLIAACGGGGSDVTGTTSSSTDSTTSAGGGIKTSAIPVGGGTVFANKKIVVTQPTAGQFKAFSAVCTHQGCLVDKVSDGTIDCPCHGSTYSIEDGSVKGGPAPSPLPEKTVTVTGNTLSVS
jgi:nitrite reductase/ring-hydroxylating ferredoxin subunit